MLPPHLSGQSFYRRSLSRWSSFPLGDSMLTTDDGFIAFHVLLLALLGNRVWHLLSPNLWEFIPVKVFERRL